MRFPSLQNALRNILSNEMEKVVREEKFLTDEPDRLESALRRCKKLTGTLVTLKRYVSKVRGEGEGAVRCRWLILIYITFAAN